MTDSRSGVSKGSPRIIAPLMPSRPRPEVAQRRPLQAAREPESALRADAAREVDAAWASARATGASPATVQALELRRAQAWSSVADAILGEAVKQGEHLLPRSLLERGASNAGFTPNLRQSELSGAALVAMKELRGALGATLDAALRKARALPDGPRRNELVDALRSHFRELDFRSAAAAGEPLMALSGTERALAGWAQQPALAPKPAQVAREAATAALLAHQSGQPDSLDELQRQLGAFARRSPSPEVDGALHLMSALQCLSEDTPRSRAALETAFEAFAQLPPEVRATLSEVELAVHVQTYRERGVSGEILRERLGPQSDPRLILDYLQARFEQYGDSTTRAPFFPALAARLEAANGGPIDLTDFDSRDELRRKLHTQAAQQANLAAPLSDGP